MEGEKIIENITKTINDRLKVPIIITYLSVLILYNWDILFYLIFEKETASIKIACIKEEYSSEYWCRILTCIAISTGLILVFTIINTTLNFCLKWFYRKDKEINSEINDYETIKNKNQQIAVTLDKIKDLNNQVKNLTKINEDLNFNLKEISISDIAKKDYERFKHSIENSLNSDKLLYSYKELIEILRLDNKTELESIYNKSTYPEAMEKLISILKNQNLVSQVTYQTDRYKRYNGLKIGTSFKEFTNFDTDIETPSLS